MDDTELFDAADAVRLRAHAPYSGYFVGAALLDNDGNLHLGCNVENASYPEGQCAEASAIAAMVAAGGRRIATIAVVGGVGRTDGRDNPFSKLPICSPCGGCRQRILEFADDKTRVLMRDSDGKIVERRIDDLLPESFKP